MHVYYRLNKDEERDYTNSIDISCIIRIFVNVKRLLLLSYKPLL